VGLERKTRRDQGNEDQGPTTKASGWGSLPGANLVYAEEKKKPGGTAVGGRGNVKKERETKSPRKFGRGESLKKKTTTGKVEIYHKFRLHGKGDPKNHRKTDSWGKPYAKNFPTISTRK